MSEIGVQLLNEGTFVWVMMPAQHMRDDIYRIVDNSIQETQDCELEFKPGSLVMVKKQDDSEGNEFLLAYRLFEDGK